MDTAAAEADIKDAVGDCPVCWEPILDPPIHQVFLAIQKIKGYTVNSRISVKIVDIPFSALLRGFMLMRELKMDQKCIYLYFCIGSFLNSVIFRYFESFYKV